MPQALRRFAPALALFAISFPLWYLGMTWRGGSGLFDHSPIDQHALQARAWLQGRLDLDRVPPSLEIAHFQDRAYNSFPPTPSLVELPLVAAFGRRTPNGLAMYAFWLAALLAMQAVLARRGMPPVQAGALALAFVFGTNVYASCVRANVWGWGQGLGFCLAVLGLSRVIDNERSGWRGPGPGYLLLALAVGCRPFYLFMAPLLVALDWKTGRGDVKLAVRDAVLWMAPFGAALAALNFARFGHPLEFGHNYLAWAQALPGGIFDLRYVGRNLFHATLRLPEWVPGGDPILAFDPWGTAFWLNNAIFLFALRALVREPLDPWVRAAAALALTLTWSGLLLHETNGWRQFGYRFLIDLLPTGFALLALTARRFTPAMAAALAWSLGVNLYGLATWKEMPRPL